MKLPSHWSPSDRANWARFERLAGRYRDDPALRARLDSGDMAGELAELGIALPDGVEARFAANTDDTYHVALPPNPNTTLADEALTQVSGGSTLGSAGCVGSMSSFACSTGPSSIGSASSAGTAGSRSV